MLRPYTVAVQRGGDKDDTVQVVGHDDEGREARSESTSRTCGTDQETRHHFGARMVNPFPCPYNPSVGGRGGAGTKWFRGPCPLPSPGAAAIARCTKSSASSTARSNGRPWASPAVMAAESVHPVPCVEVVSRRGRLKRRTAPSLTRRSTTWSPARWP